MNALVARLDRLRAQLGGGLQRLVLASEARRHAKLVQVLPLGPGSRLLVVEFGGQRHLIAQARSGLVWLAEAPGDQPS